MADNKVLYGLEKVHIAFLNDEDTPAWDTPVAIPGAVSFTLEPQGESSTFYADNTAYYTVTANNGYTGELEVSVFPNEVLARMLGWEVDSNGALVEIADGKPEPFALMGQFQGDERNRRFVLFHTTASRSSEEHNTQESSITPDTSTLSFTCVPIQINGKKVVKSTLELNDDNEEAYNNFFNEVLLPSFNE